MYSNIQFKRTWPKSVALTFLNKIVQVVSVCKGLFQVMMSRGKLTFVPQPSKWLLLLVYQLVPSDELYVALENLSSCTLLQSISLQCKWKSYRDFHIFTDEIPLEIPNDAHALGFLSDQLFSVKESFGILKLSLISALHRLLNVDKG